MPDLQTTTVLTQLSPPDADSTIRIREKVIGTKVSVQQLAEAHKVTERAVYNAINRYKIPFIKVLGKRLLEPEDWRAAFVERNTAPRGRGRPRNAR